MLPCVTLGPIRFNLPSSYLGRTCLAPSFSDTLLTVLVSVRNAALMVRSPESLEGAWEMAAFLTVAPSAAVNGHEGYLGLPALRGTVECLRQKHQIEQLDGPSTEPLCRVLDEHPIECSNASI